MKKIKKIFAFGRILKRYAFKQYARRGVIYRKIVRGVKKNFAPRWKESVAFLLLVALFAGSFWGNSASAATYTFTQTDWSGGVDAVSTASHASNRNGWNKYAEINNLSSSNGSLNLSVASSTFTETFSSTSYKDTVNTTANWNTSSGVLQIMQEQGVDLRSELDGIFGNVNINASIKVGDDIYIAGGSGKFAKYNIPNDTAIDLSSKTGLGTNISFTSLAYDSVNNDIYLVGTSGSFSKYSIPSDAGTSLVSKVQGIIGSTTLNAVVYSSGNVYLAGASSRLLKYSTATATATDYTSTISSTWASVTIQALLVNTSTGDIYIGASNGKFGRFSSSNVLTDLTSKISSFWLTNSVSAMSINSSGQIIYLGGGGGKFAKYDIAAATATNLSTAISTTIFTSPIYTVTYDSSRNSVYLGGAVVNFVEYNISTNTSSIIGRTTDDGASIYIYTSVSTGDGNVVFAGTGGKVYRYNRQTNTSAELYRSGLSNIWFGKTAYMVYDTIGNDVYLKAANTSRRFIKYDLDNGLISDFTDVAISGFGPGDSFSSTSKIDIDVSRRAIYMVGEKNWDDGYDGGTAAAMYKFDMTAGTMSVLPGISYAVAIDQSTGNVYSGGSSGYFYRYNPSNGQTTDLTSKVTSLIGAGYSIVELSYDSFSNSIYIGTTAKLLRYSIDSNSATDITPSISTFWGINPINSIAPSGSGLIWLSGGAGKFASYNSSTGTATDRSSSLNTAATISEAYATTDGSLVYLMSTAGAIFKYDVATGTASNLTSQISSFWGNNPINSGFLINRQFYFAGYNGFSKLVSGCGESCVAQSSTVDNVPVNIIGATLSRTDSLSGGTIVYYLSNDGGSTWQTTTPGEQLSFTSTGSDLRFKVTLSGNATVQDLSINYQYLASTGYLVSSVYDSSDATNVMSGVSWDEQVGSGSGVTLSIRTGSTSTLTSSWTDISLNTSGCSKDEEAGRVTCTIAAIPEALKNAQDDQWFQYKVTLNSASLTPAVSEVRITYVVNIPPEFNTEFPSSGGSGVSAYQISDRNDADFGNVKVQYSVRDIDTALGSNTPGYITPSFEFNIGGGWVPIQNTYLRAGDLDNKSVDSTTFSTYSAVWDVASQIPGQSVANAAIRVTINDNEGANNLTTATAAAFSLDTSVPTIGTFSLDSASNQIDINASDSSLIEYRISGNADFSGSEWVEVGTTTIDSIIVWNSDDTQGDETVYMEVRDAFGNTSSRTGVAPSEPIYLDLRDVGNAQNNEFREFLSWKVYVPSEGAAFSGYEVYRSTDGESYSLITTIRDISQNFFTDNTVSTGNTYYYKVTTIDTDGDKSRFSSIVSDTPDGQGGTDFTAPIISNVTVAETQTGWVKITWSTDEISDSIVEYSTVSAGDYSLSKSSASLVTDHEIVVDGLSANTNYIFRVKSSDILNNQGVDDNGGNGHTFTTISGPSIDGVAVRSANDTSANIVWYTDGPADSHVVYATDLSALRAGENTTVVGSDEFVSDPFEHSVDLTGLVTRTTYYFYVTSKDEESGIETIDNNSGEYYEFNTTVDRRDPRISNIETPLVSPNAATITWSTDELADSVVEYGEAPDQFAKSSAHDPTLSISHIITLNGLVPQTTYYFRIKSIDSAGNRAVATSSVKTISDIKKVYLASEEDMSGTTEDTSFPTINNIEVADISAFSSTIKFSTSEETTAFVEFGEKENYGKTVGSSSFKTNHEVNIFGLRGGTEYNYQVKVFDKSGNETASPNQTFKTKFAAEELDDLVKLENMQQFQDKIESLIESTLPSLVPPVISDVEVVRTSENEAEIAWNTNVKTFGSIALVKNEQYVNTKDNPYDFEMSDTAEKTRTHKMTLKSLEPATQYHFQVRSFSIPGVVGKSKDYTFATLASNLKGGAIAATNNSITLSWQTADETTSFVEYKNLKTGEVGRFGKEEYTRNHIVEVNNLPGATTFEAYYFGVTRDGVRIQGAPLRVTTIKDDSAPVLTNVSVSSAFVPYRPNQLQTIVSWRTEEPANSIVQYEEGTGNSENLAGEAGEKNEYVKEHVVILPGFRPGTVYRMRIISEDMAGNKGIVPTRTIITPTATDSVFEIIIKNFDDVFGFLKNLR